MNILAKHDITMGIRTRRHGGGGEKAEDEKEEEDNANMKKDLGENIKVLMTLEEQ